MRNFTTDAITFLVFLLPGFITLKVIALKIDVKKEEYQYFLVEALLYSICIYMIAGFLHLTLDLLAPATILSLFFLSILLGILFAELKKRETLARVFRSTKAMLSTQDKVFYANADKFFGKWNVIGLKDGKEILGVIQSFNTENNELLIRDGQWVIQGKLAPDKAWIYLPPNNDIQYIRTLEQQEE